jgi:hypothetical protein
MDGGVGGGLCTRTEIGTSRSRLKPPSGCREWDSCALKSLLRGAIPSRLGFEPSDGRRRASPRTGGVYGA